MNTLYDAKIQGSALEEGAAEHKRKMVKPAFEIILFEDIDIITSSTPFELTEAPIDEEDPDYDASC